MKKQIVVHEQSRLIYTLRETPEGVYLASQDGIVPSGQLLSSTTIEEALRDNPDLKKLS